MTPLRTCRVLELAFEASMIGYICERFAGAFKVVSELSWTLKKIRLNCFVPRDVKASYP